MEYDKIFRHGRWVFIGLLMAPFFLIGCRDVSVPALSLLGSYFPIWLANAGLGIVTAIAVRVMFIIVGIDEVLPCRLFVYTCLAIAVSCLSSLIFNVR